MANKCNNKHATHVFEQKHVHLTSSKNIEDLLYIAKLHKNVALEIQKFKVFIYDITEVKSI